MKSLFAILCTSSLLYSAPSVNTETEEIPLDLKYPQEIVAIDTNTITQQPIFAEEMQIPKPILETKYKSPGVAVMLSSLFPGLGHVYLGDMKTAGTLMGSASAGITGIFYTKKNVRLSSLLTLQTAMSYGVYSAYRDARMNNGAPNYVYKMPTDSFVDLSLAPFRWKVLKKPEVWGGFLGAFALVITTNLLTKPKEAHIAIPASTREMKIPPFLALPIGLSEEALYRGYLQSELSEGLTPVGGIVLSSMIFGASHIPNALLLEAKDRRHYYTVSVPLITALGAYFGWVTYKNNSLQESVAVHTWYDFVILTAQSLATQAVTTRCSRFSFAFSF